MESKAINLAIREWSGINRDDFYLDLNAIHEAVLHLRKTGNQFQWLDYPQNLFNVIWRRDVRHADCIVGAHAFDVINATADQCTEALLRTIGKWQDDTSLKTKVGS